MNEEEKEFAKKELKLMVIKSSKLDDILNQIIDSLFPSIEVIYDTIKKHLEELNLE